MKYFLIAIGGILGVALILKYWDKIFAPSTIPDSNPPIIPVNVPTDGTPCATEGYVGGNNGVYQNGKCQPNTPSKEDEPVRFSHIKITNPKGARTLSMKDGIFITPSSTIFIPEGTVIAVAEYVTSPSVYYYTTSGWVDGNDAQILPMETT